ncbi:secreted RxLR effector protein 161-like [Lathyrus oleraceus]|uniref:secreted RxLR effector protein 161-like n=1 Tax=Pisum sativum TaxID=3888 RepID=UPI0021D2D99C|nr:secreted RxLR effector protein 161-like [Pisum sativum]
MEKLNAKVKELKLENTELQIKMNRVVLENQNLKYECKGKAHELEDSNKRSSEPMLQLSKSEHEQDVNPTQYRRLVRSLWYLCNTIPDLVFSVEIVSRFMERPNVCHLATIKRILRYVKGSISYEILFPATDNGRKCNLLIYTDFNWCSDKDDIKSTSGYIFMYRETPISWRLKKKPVVTFSSCEAEFIATSLCACQAVWFMNVK